MKFRMSETSDIFIDISGRGFQRRLRVDALAAYLMEPHARERASKQITNEIKTIRIVKPILWQCRKTNRRAIYKSCGNNTTPQRILSPPPSPPGCTGKEASRRSAQRKKFNYSVGTYHR